MSGAGITGLLAWWLRQGAFPLPLAPTGLTAVKGDNEITISWNNPNNKSLKGYQYSVDSGDYTTIPGADRTTTSFIFAAVNGTTYTLKVRAFNKTGFGAGSATIIVALIAPLAPTGFTVTASGTNLVLAWTDPGDAEIESYEYRGRFRLDGATYPDYGDWVAIANSGPDTVTYTEVRTALDVGFYEHELRAVNSYGASPVATSQLAVT